VSQVQQAIHVRIRKVAEKFNRFRFVRVHLEHLGIVPRFLRDGLVGRELVSSRRRSLLVLLLIVLSRHISARVFWIDFFILGRLSDWISIERALRARLKLNSRLSLQKLLLGWCEKKISLSLFRLPFIRVQRARVCNNSVSMFLRRPLFFSLCCLGCDTKP
jgi:hypothetical protein